MYETHSTVVGTVITHPVKRPTPSGEEVLSFRMASNVRRMDRVTGEWADGGTLYLTVCCWRRLVTGVGASIMRGDPIIAYGELRTNEYTTKDGAPRADLEMRASAVGPDLARCIAKLERGPKGAGPDGGVEVDGGVEAFDATARDTGGAADGLMSSGDAVDESVFANS